MFFIILEFSKLNSCIVKSTKSAENIIYDFFKSLKNERKNEKSGKSLLESSLESFLGNENPCNFVLNQTKESLMEFRTRLLCHKTDLLLKDHQ